MEQRVLTEALVLSKRMGNLFGELMDVSKQLAEAADRGDQVVIRMLVGLRAEPIDKLKETEHALHVLCDSASEEDSPRLRELLNGGKPGKSREEVMLSELVASNRRVYDQVMELDRIVNRKLAKDKSIYQ